MTSFHGPRSLPFALLPSLLVLSCSSKGLDSPRPGAGSDASADSASADLSTGGSNGSGGGSGGNGGSGGVGGSGGSTVTPDAAQTCSYNGRSYPLGEGFILDCNSCVCMSSGMACTGRICLHDAAPDLPSSADGPSCALSTNLTFGPDGGNAIYADVNRLTANSFTITRNYAAWANPDGGSSASCSPPLPACGSAAVTIATINADLAQADVQSVWALPQTPTPLFGSDSRPVDGTVYSIALDDGRKVWVGEQCASPVMSSCRYIPTGLVQLVQDLQKLASAMLADAACKALR